MLDKKLLKKGMRVYRVEWMDSLDPYIVVPIPRVREYEITQVGPKFLAVRQIGVGKRAGQLGGQTKATTAGMLLDYEHTAEAALTAGLMRARQRQRAAMLEYAHAKRDETLLVQSKGAELVAVAICLLDHRGATVMAFPGKAWRLADSDVICPLPVRFTTTTGIYVVSAVAKCDGARPVSLNFAGRNLAPGDALDIDWKGAVLA